MASECNPTFNGSSGILATCFVLDSVRKDWFVFSGVFSRRRHAPLEVPGLHCLYMRLSIKGPTFAQRCAAGRAPFEMIDISFVSRVVDVSTA